MTARFLLRQLAQGLAAQATMDPRRETGPQLAMGCATLADGERQVQQAQRAAALAVPVISVRKAASQQPKECARQESTAQLRGLHLPIAQGSAALATFALQAASRPRRMSALKDGMVQPQGLLRQLALGLAAQATMDPQWATRSPLEDP